MDPVSIFNQSPIKGTFVCHMMLIALAVVTVDWMPKGFYFYNLMFFISLFWSLASSHNSEPVQLAVIINLLSILLDLMCIATNYSSFHYRGWFGFSLFILICNLVLRAVTSIVLLRVYNERSDRFGSGDNRPFIGPNSSDNIGYQSSSRGYENLDAIPTSVTVEATKNTSPHSKTNLNTYQSVPGPITLTTDDMSH